MLARFNATTWRSDTSSKNMMPTRNLLKPSLYAAPFSMPQVKIFENLWRSVRLISPIFNAVGENF